MIPVLTKSNPIAREILNDSFILLLDKEEGWTSFDVVKKLRGLLKIRKIGHAGTLDPFASGLLIIGVGKATRQLSQHVQAVKKYRAVIRFGAETDTYDKTGELLASASTESIKKNDIERALAKLKGPIEQVPPMFSAKKIQGRRLYELARKKIVVERAPVVVNIYDVVVLDWENPRLRLELSVSKGTYIRSYAHDLGQLIGCGAHLEELRRLAIGDMTIDESFKMDEFREYWSEN